MEDLLNFNWMVSFLSMFLLSHISEGMFLDLEGLAYDSLFLV